MDWTTEKLQELTEFSTLPSFTVGDIANVMGVSKEELVLGIGNPQSEIAKAIQKGRLKARAEFDKRVTTLSKQGSGPAQALELKLRKANKIDELLERYG